MAQDEQIKTLAAVVLGTKIVVVCLECETKTFTVVFV